MVSFVVGVVDVVGITLQATIAFHTIILPFPTLTVSLLKIICNLCDAYDFSSSFSSTYINPYGLLSLYVFSHLVIITFRTWLWGYRQSYINASQSHK